MVSAKTPNGFTLIELLVVMAIIATLLTIAVPRYSGSVDRSKEVVLKQSLAVMREAIDKYHGDTGQYPDSLEDLVTKRYLRKLPLDPITDSASSWIVVPVPDGGIAGKVYDIKSGADGRGREGGDFREW
jgi:general secretion pathway protein G